MVPWAGLTLTCLSSSKGRLESLSQAPERHGLGWVSGRPWQAQAQVSWDLMLGAVGSRGYRSIVW